MPKIPERKPQRSTTFLEYVCERLLGPPDHCGTDYAAWLCLFHNDTHPSFHTRPHKPEYDDKFHCFGCGAWGDEFDLLKLVYPKENYGDRIERLRIMREQYEAAGLANGPALTPRGSGSTAGATILRALLRAGQVDHCDLLEVAAELNPRRRDGEPVTVEALVGVGWLERCPLSDITADLRHREPKGKTK